MHNMEPHRYTRRGITGIFTNHKRRTTDRLAGQASLPACVSFQVASGVPRGMAGQATPLGITIVYMLF